MNFLELTPLSRAAQIELSGEQIPLAIERGRTYNHVHKVKRAQDGLLRHIQAIKNRLDCLELLSVERHALQQELSKASKLLDYTEEFMPRLTAGAPLSHNIKQKVFQ